MTPSPHPDKPTSPKISKTPYLLALFTFIVANRCADQLIEARRPLWQWLPVAGVAAAAMVYALWRGEMDFMRSQDELQQKIRTEALACAFPVALGVFMLLGRLDAVGLAFIPVHAFWIPATLPYFLILAGLKRRYQ